MARRIDPESILDTVLKHRYPRPSAGDAPGHGDPYIPWWVMLQDLACTALGRGAASGRATNTEAGLAALSQVSKTLWRFFGGDLLIRCYACASLRVVRAFSRSWAFTYSTNIRRWQCSQCRWFGYECQGFVHPQCIVCARQNGVSAAVCDSSAVASS